MNKNTENNSSDQNTPANMFISSHNTWSAQVHGTGKINRHASTASM
jgi:hypothetical protein